MFPWTINSSSVENSNQLQVQPNHEKEQVQTEKPSAPVLDENGMEEWEYFVGVGEQVLKMDEPSDEKQALVPVSATIPAPIPVLAPIPVPKPKPDLKKFQQDLKNSWSRDAAEILINLIPEKLKSSQYFYYEKMKDELELVQDLLKVIFPAPVPAPAPAQDSFCLETLHDELSKMTHTKSEKNKKRCEKIQQELTEAADLMWKSEFHSWKKIVEKCAPEPIDNWTIELLKTIEEMHNQYFGPLLNSILTNRKQKCSTSQFDLDLDLQFQKECNDSSFKKTTTLYYARFYAGALIGEYARIMKEEFEKKGYFPSQEDFTLLHQTTLLAVNNQNRFFKRAKDFDSAWNQLDEPVKFAVEEYQKQFWLKNLKILQQQDELVEKIVDFALAKYEKFIHGAKIEFQGFGSASGSKSSVDVDVGSGSKIWKPFQLSSFHANGWLAAQYYFNNKYPQFKYQITRERVLKKLEEKIGGVRGKDLEENERKIKRVTSQQKLVMPIAEDVYRKMMTHVFSSFSPDQLDTLETRLELENFHLEAMKWNLDFYEQKLEQLYQFYYYQGNGIQGQQVDQDKDKNKEKDKEILKSKCAEIKEQLLREHKEKEKESVAMAMKETKEIESLQQKLSSQNTDMDVDINIEISNTPEQISPLQSNNIREILEGAVAGTSSKNGATFVTRENDIIGAVAESEEIVPTREQTEPELQLLVLQLTSQLKKAQAELSTVRDENKKKLFLDKLRRRLAGYPQRYSETN